MPKEKNGENLNQKGAGTTGASSAVYGLGVVGALVYYIQHASTFKEVLIGVIKALVWPAILVYKSLELLKL